MKKNDSGSEMTQSSRKTYSRSRTKIGVMEHIHYSCVVDKPEKFKNQGWLWINSLIKMGGIKPENIWAHCVAGIDAEYVRKCKTLGVNVGIIEPFGDKKYCNKIAQMSNKKLKESDIIILMDTDMIMLENFGHLLVDIDYITAKIVDLENPPVEAIDAVFAAAGLKKALPDSFTGYKSARTYGANFNGGLYIIPAKYYDIIETGWHKWARWLLDNGAPLYDIGKEAHIDQISFCMTVHENNLDIKYLAPAYNYPLPFDYGIEEKLYVMHYHDKIAEDFSSLLLDYEPGEHIKKAVDKANDFIRGINN